MTWKNEAPKPTPAQRFLAEMEAEIPTDRFEVPEEEFKTEKPKGETPVSDFARFFDSQVEEAEKLQPKPSEGTGGLTYWQVPAVICGFPIVLLLILTASVYPQTILILTPVVLAAIIVAVGSLGIERVAKGVWSWLKWCAIGAVGVVLLAVVGSAFKGASFSPFLTFFIVALVVGVVSKGRWFLFFWQS